MKQFVLFTGKILLVLLLSAFVLDFIYTIVFAQSETRNKVENVINSKPQKYDSSILGTSRANNHFVPELFEQKGLKTFNYGMSGAHLMETSLMLKLMLERGWQIKNIILETDLNLSNEKRDPGTTAWMMPFLHRSETIREHYRQEADFKALYYIPLYRYIEFDNRIGFRALWQTATHQPTVFLKNQGYYPLANTSKGKMKNNIKNLKLLRNRYYEEIKDLCQKNNIRLIAVMTPMCENTVGMDYFSKVKALYPEIYNYENAVEGDQYFSSCGHLNDSGARKFTTRISNDFFKN